MLCRRLSRLSAEVPLSTPGRVVALCSRRALFLACPPLLARAPQSGPATRRKSRPPPAESAPPPLRADSSYQDLNPLARVSTNPQALGYIAAHERAFRAANAADTAISNRRAFRSIPIQPKLMAYITELKLGRRQIRSKQERRSQVKSLKGNQDVEPAVKAVFSRKFKRIREALTPEEFPPSSLPEVAFAGRSNVGKSSLLKSLCARYVKIATENRPGTTRTINFYEMPKLLRMVDLPGYGFAFAKEDIQLQWLQTMHQYFAGRGPLKRVLVLVDARHGLKPSDEYVFSVLDEAKVKYQLVFTKCDLVTPEDLARRATFVKERLRAFRYAMRDSIMMISSATRAGIPQLWGELASLFDPEEMGRVRASVTEFESKSRAAQEREALDAAEQPGEGKSKWRAPRLALMRAKDTLQSKQTKIAGRKKAAKEAVKRAQAPAAKEAVKRARAAGARRKTRA